LVGEEVILVGDQQDGGRKRQISTPVSTFSAIVGKMNYPTKESDQLGRQ